MTDKPQAPGRIVAGPELRRDVEERPDVCVVGSGAGGAVVAAHLAQKGLKVVVLEEGGRFGRADFRMDEATAYPRLYMEKGTRATADQAITVLQGRAVGGSTVVNWTTSYRLPDRVLAHWAAAHGVEGLPPAALAPHFAAVEERLHVHEQPLAEVNPNNRVLWDGAQKLGLERALIRRNVRGCANLGYCGLGCPIDAKASMDLTYLPDAVRAGARIYANARAARIERSGKRAAAVVATVLDPASDRPTGRKITVRPRVLVLSAGAVGTPELLLRNEMNPNGRVGLRTFLHPVTASLALFRERIEGWRGAPQSVGSHAFAEPGPGKVGFFLEAAPLHPMLSAAAAPGIAGEHQELMSRLPNANALIALAIDGFLPEEAGGTVSLRSDGRVRIDYPIRPQVWEALREGAKVLARIQLAAGAEAVYSLHEDPVVMRSAAEVALLDRAPWLPARVGLFSAHAMGGCAMGGDPKRSVVDSRLKMHHYENVWVVDGSVFPTSLGVNPQETIFALARWAADHVAQGAG
ncbi:MAG TPA: GMC family oxidoreductase [Anaeromyxobacteraceae bacterium]|nr:GMC family oxidoreductase [Anaeromyxobacteraceae bacterium]